MTLHHHPALMNAGRTAIISPDGSHQLPPDLFAEYAAIVLLEPEPELLGQWVRKLEDSLGVTDAQRVEMARRTANRSIRPWTILTVTPGMERKAAAALGPATDEHPHGAGLTVYVPLERYRPARTWRSRTRPLMPGYIFADLRDEADLDTAREHHAIRDVMVSCGAPVKVPALAIGSMILAEAWGAFDTTWSAPAPIRGKRRRPPRSKWKKGQRVKVAEGPFAGFVAEIVKAERADRIEAVVDLFGRATPVRLDEEMLEEPAAA